MADTQVPNTPAAVAVEAVKQPDTAVAATTPDSRLEALARKERQFHKQRKELEARESAWKAKQSEYETNYIPKSRLTEDPLSALSEAGIDYNKLTEILLNSPNSNDPTIRALRAEINAIKSAQDKASQANDARAAAQEEQALRQITTEVKLLVDSNEAFETIKETGMQEAVVELIKQRFDSDGYLMEIEEAAKEIEDHLMAEAIKMSKLKKLQPKLKTEEPVSSPRILQQSQTTPRTLTNTVSAQSPQRNSEKERLARAMAAFKGELK